MALRLMGRDEKSFVINQSTAARQRSEARNGKGAGITLKNKSINMAGINGENDALSMRKQLARKRANKLINDAWSGDKKINMDIDELRLKSQEKKDVVYECNDHIREAKEQEEALMAYYGIDEYTDADRELIERKNLAKYDPELSFTEDEKKRLEELESPNFVKYREQIMGLELSISKYEMDAEKAWKDVTAYNSEISGIKLERLKFHEMADAQKKADEINEAASKDAISTLIGEAQEHIKETLEEKREEEKEKAEEKEEQEEKIEEKREEKEEFEARLELEREESHENDKLRLEQEKEARKQADIIENAKENSGDASALPSQVKAEIKEMLQKMKLLEEDLKGCEVDDTV